MKRLFILYPLSFILLCSAFSSSVPQPSCVYFGQALDGYGWPYSRDAAVLMFCGTNEISRCEVDGAMSPGVNFMLPVHLHDGASNTNAYVPVAVRPGDRVAIRVQDAYGQKTIIESSTIPAVGQPGDMLRIRATAGTDADGDGMADDFELEMLANNAAHPDYHSIWDILPWDDFDGDGVSNGDEYRSGTFAFLDYDYFFAERFAATNNGRLRIEFLSVPGKAYSVQGARDLKAPAWQPCPWSGSAAGALATGPQEGTGNWLSFYVPATNTMPILRLEVE